LLSSYPASLIKTENCIFNRTVEFNERADGEKALRLLFIPGPAVSAKETVSEIYQFDLTPKETVIVTTSSQPESIIDDEQDVSVIQEIKNLPSSQENQEPQAFFSRKFLTPQNWEGCNNLNFFLKHDDSSNLFFVRLKDAKGSVWSSEPIELQGNGWQEHQLSLSQTSLSLNEIVEIGFGLRAAPPSMETILFLDEITLN
jgi:hypothetical protein